MMTTDDIKSLFTFIPTENRENCDDGWQLNWNDRITISEHQSGTFGCTFLSGNGADTRFLSSADFSTLESAMAAAVWADDILKEEMTDGRKVH